jgi:hypothetical protein
MLNRLRKERVAERLSPGDREPFFGSPGSIEQKLDMCEGEGSMRGDEILHNHGLDANENESEYGVQGVDELIEANSNFQCDLSEESREGDEMSGDEHSSGWQGGEPELLGQPHIATGMPGDRSLREDIIERSNYLLHTFEEEGIPVHVVSKKGLFKKKKNE